MTDQGAYIQVEAGEMSIDDLIQTIQNRQKPIHICRNGERVADLIPPLPDRRPSDDPRLKAIITPDYDPCEGFSEDEWPEHLR